MILDHLTLFHRLLHGKSLSSNEKNPEFLEFEWVCWQKGDKYLSRFLFFSC